MSDIEKFFYAVQAKQGGNLLWEHLNPTAQIQFVHAVNIIFQLTSLTQNG